MVAAKTINLEKVQLQQAVSALLQLAKPKRKSELLLSSGVSEKINVVIGFNKIPTVTDNKRVKISLPNPLSSVTTSICLFVKDIDREQREYEDTLDHFKELLQTKKVTADINIIPLRALKTEYSQFEAKIRLSKMYDVYLADDRIIPNLGTLLGRNFYKKKKFPVPVNLKATDLLKVINDAVNNTVLIVGGRGSCCMYQVAHTGHTELQVIENIETSVAKLCEVLPGGAVNIKSLQIKTTNQTAIPFYYNNLTLNGIKLPVVQGKKEIVEAEDVTTIENAKVKVYKSGRIVLVPEKKLNKNAAVGNRKRKLDSTSVRNKENDTKNGKRRRTNKGKKEEATKTLGAKEESDVTSAKFSSKIGNKSAAKKVSKTGTEETSAAKNIIVELESKKKITGKLSKVKNAPKVPKLNKKENSVKGVKKLISKTDLTKISTQLSSVTGNKLSAKKATVKTGREEKSTAKNINNDDSVSAKRIAGKLSKVKNGPKALKLNKKGKSLKGVTKKLIPNTEVSKKKLSKTDDLLMDRIKKNKSKSRS